MDLNLVTLKAHGAHCEHRDVVGSPRQQGGEIMTGAIAGDVYSTLGWNNAPVEISCTRHQRSFLPPKFNGAGRLHQDRDRPGRIGDLVGEITESEHQQAQ